MSESGYTANHYVKYLAFLILVLAGARFVRSSEQGKTIEVWADKLGEELYDLGRAITKSDELKKSYSTNNAQVRRKDPKKLLAEVVENISRMVDRKVDAIKCILKVAEDEAENFDYTGNGSDFFYFSSKYSAVDDVAPELPEALEKFPYVYLPMYLNNDTHFYNVAVNTTHSSVHVPVNIFDRYRHVQNAIQWSEKLDEVFVQNYNSDPALTWQYFGSTSGIMRHYPAMQWKQEDIDMFDCRTRTWFIEAATCTKDVVILVDSSGSMQGMRKHIATMTISSILDTFSNNDYVNVLNYSTSVNYTVPCFEDMLVQATKENLNTFKLAVSLLDPNNKTNASQALEAGFDLLNKYRIPERCGPDNSECNQLIMLVTDGIAGNLSDIFDVYNRYNNGSKIPVRIFTYLIGPEVTKVNEIMWAACTNRGYYSHVESLEEVAPSIFKYISVIARPLVLQKEQHPVSWTHAYSDITYDDAKDNVFNEPYRLLTSVAVPAYDRKVNRDNSTVRADLLGVAATDVPIDDIRRLTMPYRIGVMGYAFIVTNNGYVLMHPSLRPVFNKTILKANYNSVDLLEVEQHDDGSGPRAIDPTSSVYELRNAMVNGENSVIYDATLKYHYDNMRRITKQTYDYYIAPIEDTPFSIGLAIPDSYGNYSIFVGNALQKIDRYAGQEITHFFKGNNWKIHPKWVYCKYHYLEGHEFDTPENELLHFLKRMNDTSFEWHRQYEAISKITNEFGIEIEDNDDTECGRKVLSDDDYYCDEDLIQWLVFDAKNTAENFQTKWNFTNQYEQRLFERYNATLRFIATMSGLTRWEYIYGEDENNTRTEFGDLNSRAIDETWYKSAILQHQHDPHSYIYSVPFEVGNQVDTLVTSSYAIFPKDGGNEAPGSVVGFQFSHKLLHKRFFEITSEAKGSTFACSDLLDCYVVDSSGYIVVSHDVNDTGRFFGEVEGAVMESMLAENIFEKIVIYDYQALCVNETMVPSSVSTLLTPLTLLYNLINAIIANIAFLFIKTTFFWHQEFVDANEIFMTPTPYSVYEDVKEEENADISPKLSEQEKEPKVKKKLVRTYYPCDLERDLFILNQSKFIKGSGYSGEVPKICSRSFYIKRIPYSNLILVAVNSTLSQCDRYYTTDPKDVEYPNEINHPCQKINLTNLPRKRLSGCFNEHELESEIKICGRGVIKQISSVLVFIISCVFLILKML